MAALGTGCTPPRPVPSMATERPPIQFGRSGSVRVQGASPEMAVLLVANILAHGREAAHPEDTEVLTPYYAGAYLRAQVRQHVRGDRMQEAWLWMSQPDWWDRIEAAARRMGVVLA